MSSMPSVPSSSVVVPARGGRGRVLMVVGVVGRHGAVVYVVHVVHVVHVAGVVHGCREKPAHTRQSMR